MLLLKHWYLYLLVGNTHLQNASVAAARFHKQMFPPPQGCLPPPVGVVMIATGTDCHIDLHCLELLIHHIHIILCCPPCVVQPDGLPLDDMTGHPQSSSRRQFIVFILLFGEGRKWCLISPPPSIFVHRPCPMHPYHYPVARPHLILA